MPPKWDPYDEHNLLISGPDPYDVIMDPRAIWLKVLEVVSLAGAKLLDLRAIWLEDLGKTLMLDFRPASLLGRRPLPKNPPTFRAYTWAVG